MWELLRFGLLGTPPPVDRDGCLIAVLVGFTCCNISIFSGRWVSMVCQDGSASHVWAFGFEWIGYSVLSSITTSMWGRGGVVCMCYCVSH